MLPSGAFRQLSQKIHNAIDDGQPDRFIRLLCRHNLHLRTTSNLSFTTFITKDKVSGAVLFDTDYTEKLQVVDVNQLTTLATTDTADAWLPQQHQATADFSVGTSVHHLH